LAAVVVIITAVALVGPSGAGGNLGSLRVALVQGGGPRGTRAINTGPEVAFLRHLSASAGLRPPLDLVVWPEGILQSHVPFATTADAGAVAAVARNIGATVVAGVDQDVAGNRYLNEVVAWGPDGQIVASYEKNHRVPFGEYIPDRALVSRFFNTADVPYDAVPGHGPGILRTPAGSLGVMISYEVFFDGRARGAVRAGGAILIVPTNTASYRSAQVPTQEVAAARMRAWETGRWVLEVTPTGYTAVISPTGRVVQKTALGVQRLLTATVPREAGRTVYVDIGDAPVALAALLLLSVGWALSRPPRASRHHDRWKFRL
jgi:apolipoprotein N-acyltransferase